MLFLDLLIPGIFLLVLFLALAFTGQIFVRVPWVPTPRPVIEAMVRAAELRGGETVYDLGAGDARILIAAKRASPGIRAVGYEIAPLPWLAGRLRIWLSGQDVRLIYGNSSKADLRDADRIFLYLFPSVMPRLERKFQKELRPGTRVISHAFRFPTKEISREVPLDFWKKRRRLYVYEW